MEGKGEDKLII